MKNFLILKNLKRATIGYFKHYVLYDLLRKKRRRLRRRRRLFHLHLAAEPKQRERGGGPTIAITSLFLLLKNVTAFTVNI